MLQCAGRCLQSDAAVLQSPATASSRPAGGPAVSALGRGDGLLEGGEMGSEPSRWINGSTFALSQTETFIGVQIPTTVDCFHVPWYLTLKKSF